MSWARRCQYVMSRCRARERWGFPPYPDAPVSAKVTLEETMSDYRQAASATAIACGLAIIVVIVSACAPARNSVAPPDTPAGPILALIDVDAHGAVLMDGRDRTVRGVRRDGEVVWRAPLDNNAAVPVSCLATCPDAVLSGSAASMNDASVPDPAPVFMVAGTPHALVGGTSQPRKRRVLSAERIDDLVLATTDDDGRSWIELHRGGPVDRIAVGGVRTTWSQSSNGRHGVAVTELAPGRAEARWFGRQPGGWWVTAGPMPVAGNGSCLTPDGDQAILLGQPPAILDRSGSASRVTDLATVGTCAFAATGAILASLTVRLAGKEAQVRVIDSSGRVTWATDVKHEVRVCADPTRARVAYVAEGILHELDTRTGAEIRTVRDVRAARYDELGDLVVLRSDLMLAWLT